MAADMRLSLLISANAQQAKAEIAGARATLDALEKSIAAVGPAAAVSTAPLTQLGRAGRTAMTEVAQAAQVAGAAVGGSALSFDQLRASVDPAFAATQRYAEVQRALASMVDSGETSQRAANIVLEQAASRYMGVATAAERRAQAERAAIITTMMVGQEYASLRAAVDPLWAASQRYEQAVLTLDTAQAAGLISYAELVQDTEVAKVSVVGLGMANGICGHI